MSSSSTRPLRSIGTQVKTRIVRGSRQSFVLRLPRRPRYWVVLVGVPLTVVDVALPLSPEVVDVGAGAASCGET